MLEDENTQKRNNMMKQLQEENKRLAQEKKDRENQWKQNQQAQNKFEMDNTNYSHIMTENPATTQSQLAPHRYVPYHFKGLRPDQIENINDTRTQQVRDNKVEKQRQADEDMQWAMQQEANRQLMLQNELELAEKQKQMNLMHRDQHLKDKVQKEIKWQNNYGEQVPLPHVD